MPIAIENRAALPPLVLTRSGPKGRRHCGPPSQLGSPGSPERCGVFRVCDQDTRRHASAASSSVPGSGKPPLAPSSPMRYPWRPMAPEALARLAGRLRDEPLAWPVGRKSRKTAVLTLCRRGMLYYTAHWPPSGLFDTMQSYDYRGAFGAALRCPDSHAGSRARMFGPRTKTLGGGGMFTPRKLSASIVAILALTLVLSLGVTGLLAAKRSTVATAEGLQSPTGLTALADGTLLVAETGAGRLLHMQPDGTTTVIEGGASGIMSALRIGSRHYYVTGQAGSASLYLLARGGEPEALSDFGAFDAASNPDAAGVPTRSTWCGEPAAASSSATPAPTPSSGCPLKATSNSMPSSPTARLPWA